MPKTLTLTPAVVNSVSESKASAGGSEDVALGFTPTAGNALVLLMGSVGAGTDVTAVTDDGSGGVAWEQMAQIDESYSGACWVCTSAGTGVSTVTVTHAGGSGHAHYHVFELVNVDAGAAIRDYEDGDPSASRSILSDYITAATLRPTTAKSLSLACVFLYTDGVTPDPDIVSVDSGWTENEATVEGTQSCMHSYSKGNAAALTANETFGWVQTNEDDNSVTFLVSFPALDVTYGATYSEMKATAESQADMADTAFISDTEWQRWANDGMRRLYDLLVLAFEDYFVAEELITGVANQEEYSLDSAFYKLLSVDLTTQDVSSVTNPDWYSLLPYHHNARNRYRNYPSSRVPGHSTRRYRIFGDQIILKPAPSGNETIRVRYVPTPDPLVVGFNTTLPNELMEHWADYITIYMTVQALRKEESNTTEWRTELAVLEKRIRSAAMERNVADPVQVEDLRTPYYDDFEGLPEEFL